MKDIVIIVEDGLVQGVYSDDGRGYVVVDGNAKNGGPYTCLYPGKTREQIPPWAVHRLRLERVDGREFEVGDRVRLSKRGFPWGNNGPQVDALGTIRLINLNYTLAYGVEFDESYDGGHGAGVSCKEGHGWFCAAEHLEFVTEDLTGWDQFKDKSMEWVREAITEKLKKEFDDEVAD